MNGARRSRFCALQEDHIGFARALGRFHASFPHILRSYGFVRPHAGVCPLEQKRPSSSLTMPSPPRARAHLWFGLFVHPPACLYPRAPARGISSWLYRPHKGASGFLQTPLSELTRRSAFSCSPASCRQVTPDSVLTSARTFGRKPDLTVGRDAAKWIVFESLDSIRPD